MGEPIYTILIPAYNEEKNLRSGVLTRIFNAITDVEILVIDDGSNDSTFEVANDHPGVKVEKTPHRGKAHALMVGMQLVNTPYLCWADCDLSTPPHDILRLLQHVSERKSDICIGSRGIKRPGQSPARYILSWGQMTMRRALFGMSLVDTQCGYKAMTVQAALSTLVQMTVFTPGNQPTLKNPNVTSGFDLEFLLVAGRIGYTIAEQPVQWRYRPSRRVNVLRDAVLGMDDMLRVYQAHQNDHLEAVKLA
jgi:dolichyl-phosphate beta-glucosyltransferase